MQFTDNKSKPKTKLKMSKRKANETEMFKSNSVFPTFNIIYYLHGCFIPYYI